MSVLRFEWDERKAVANQRRHGVAFEEARTVFFGERARLIDDPDHSKDEERFILLGLEQYASPAPGLPLLPQRRRRYPHYLGTQGYSARG